MDATASLVLELVKLGAAPLTVGMVVLLCRQKPLLPFFKLAAAALGEVLALLARVDRAERHRTLMAAIRVAQDLPASSSSVASAAPGAQRLTIELKPPASTEPSPALRQTPSG